MARRDRVHHEANKSDIVQQKFKARHAVIGLEFHAGVCPVSGNRDASPSR